MSETLLSTIDLAVSAGGTRLLEGITLKLHAGEMLALTGPSGCGKTSLLRAIAGLDDPDAGEVRFREQPPEHTGWPAFRRHVTFVHQRPVMLNATVEENLRRPFRYRHVAREFDRDRAVALLKDFGLGEEHLAQEARTLSIGQQQRVSVVRALLIEPAVLLLDEPTSALDEDARSAVENLLRREGHRNGRAALLVTHDREQARRLCDRSLDLREHLPEAGPRMRGGDDG
ncbi:MAG: ATP-binding cassette domain-containing protein [Planctomycetota bacterium]|nr:ATP-binding cassette domain-containing protein [Planctomycetota bacterium]